MSQQSEVNSAGPAVSHRRWGGAYSIRFSGWVGFAFVKVELIVIMKGSVSGWGGLYDRQHHPNVRCWSGAVFLRLVKRGSEVSYRSHCWSG